MVTGELGRERSAGGPAMRSVGLAMAFTAIMMAALAPSSALAASGPMTPFPNSALPSLVLKVRTCKSYRNCAAAVRSWCAGRHPRADRDNDGIPCENVCRSRRQVVSIMKKIGCSR